MTAGSDPEVYRNPHPAPDYPMEAALEAALTAACAEPDSERCGVSRNGASCQLNRSLRPVAYAMNGGADNADEIVRIGDHLRAYSAQLPQGAAVTAKIIFDWTGEVALVWLNSPQRTNYEDARDTVANFGRAVRVHPLICRGVPINRWYELKFRLDNGSSP